MSEKTNSVKRALRVIKALKGKSLTGLSNKELAERLNENPVNITRAIQALMEEGFVTKLDNGLFALSLQITQIGVTHLTEIDNAKRRLEQLTQRSAVLLD